MKQPPLITAETAPLYYEKFVAARLGLSKSDARYLRRELLQKRKDWTILGRFVVLTEPAVNCVVAYVRNASSTLPKKLDFSDCLVPSPSQKKEAAAALVTLTVSRILPNDRLLMAVNPDGPGRDVMVKVRDNKNFRPRMTLQARPIGRGMYQMEGRCPRRPGRY